MRNLLEGFLENYNFLYMISLKRITSLLNHVLDDGVDGSMNIRMLNYSAHTHTRTYTHAHREGGQRERERE